MIRAVVFDMDGVIFDTERIYRIAWRQAAEELGGIPEIDEDVRICTGRNHEDIRTYFLERYGTEFPYDRLMERRSVYIDERLQGNGPPFKPGVPGILDWLHANGFLVALATSTNQARTAMYMALSGIGDRFNRIINGSMVTHSKPSPDIYCRACESLGLEPSECVAVEDSPNGLRSGYAAGMTTVMIPDLVPFSGELAQWTSFVCQDMEELKLLLCKLNRKEGNSCVDSQ